MGKYDKSAWLPIGLALVALSLLSRALIPAGFMLGPELAGHASLIPCTGYAQPIHHHGSRNDKAAPASPCPFAVLAQFASPADPPIVPAPPLPHPFLFPIAADPALLIPAAAAPRPPSTGPPMLA